MLISHARSGNRLRTPPVGMLFPLPYARGTRFILTACIRQTSWWTQTAPPGLPALATRSFFPTPRRGQRRVESPKPMICMTSGLWLGRYRRIPLYDVYITHSTQVFTIEITATRSIMSGSMPSRPNHSEVSDIVWQMIKSCLQTEASRRVEIGEVVTLLEAEMARALVSGA